uniref:MlaE family lipid ABC transporter permease subunit n=1 Tax=Gronococcus sybilensis TaxID=3028029 RepID=A0A9Y1I2M4_9RHOD|nr:MlaE family lipid ABC transporter permease subunit [Gronococcus sybilensis]
MNTENNFFRWVRRFIQALTLFGEILIHLKRNKLYKRNLLEQLHKVGIQSLSISLMTAYFVGMVFTIQVAKDFIEFDATYALGGVLSLALIRELSPVLTAVIIAGRIGSAFTAEIGTMKVTEQIDALNILKTNPIDYLIIPRILACAVMLPFLNFLSFLTGVSASILVSAGVYDIGTGTFLNSLRGALTITDIANSSLKALIFGILIGLISCNWGLTTEGGSKNVGTSTTIAVVTCLLFIFITDFFLTYVMYRNAASSMGSAMQ